MMNNITPAMKLDDISKLSAEEFQNQLCSWMDHRGLLLELRAYFKTNMVEILKNTSAGSSLGIKSKVPSSPKLQVINLLVAEYLGNSEYHFSLSVFATEVALNNIFCTNTEGPNMFRFTEKEVFDILETLGIMRHNRQAKYIYHLYEESKEPLISFFLPSPPYTKAGIGYDNDSLSNVLNGEYQFGVENINKILVNSNLLPEEIAQLKYYIKWICEKQKDKEKQLQTDLRIDAKLQISKYKLKIHDMEIVFRHEKKYLENEIADLKRRLDALQKEECRPKNDNVKDKKERIEMKTTSADAAVETDVVLENKSCQCDSDAYKERMECLEAENALLKANNKTLEIENEALRSDNKNFMQELDDLGRRASNLMTELSVSQQNIVRLTTILQNNSHENNQPIAMRRDNILSFTGGGEEYLRSDILIPPPMRSYRKTSRHSSIASTSSNGSTATEIILNEARERLRHLEEESKSIMGDVAGEAFRASSSTSSVFRFGIDVNSTGSSKASDTDENS